MAKVIPIFKSDDETHPNNYRPISLLSCFNRIFEKLVFKRLKSFIDERKIISSSKYGFREGHSTEHAILDIVNAIQSNMDVGKFSCGVFVDLKKGRLISHSVLVEFLKAQFWDHCSFSCMLTTFIAAQRNLNSIYLLMIQIFFIATQRP